MECARARYKRLIKLYIQCKGEWYHCTCVRIDDDEYGYLSASDDSWPAKTAAFLRFNSIDAIAILTHQSSLYGSNFIADCFGLTFLGFQVLYDGLYVA